MCGIIGFSGKDIQKLNQMLRQIHHRGPDDQGMYQDDDFSLGHVRLSILDLSNAGHQPMQYEHLVIVFNGEIYNFQEIKTELSEYTFHSQSDTEVVLKAFHKWGVKAVDKFIGMFAFAIWDKNDKKLFLFRDRTGVKPLYYYINEENFAFGSEPSALHAFEPNLSINQNALAEFFQYGYIPTGKSIYNDCFQVPPGNFLVYQNGKITIKAYWSINHFFTLPKFKKSEKELIDELELLLIDACKLRMVSDVPVGIFLSGGIDSSVVAAILQKHYGNVHTFTIGFNEKRYNEASYAKAVAEHLGTTHTEKILELSEARTILEHLPIIYSEPFGDSSGIPTTLVSQMAKEVGVKVVLSADGGDELFCGYERYWITNKIARLFFNMPYWLRKKTASMIESIGPKWFAKILPVRNFDHKYSQLIQMLREPTWEAFYTNILHTFKDSDIVQLTDCRSPIHEHAFELGMKENPMQGMMLWDYHHYLPYDILTKVDRATMSVSIEGREPLLDHRIAEFMAQIPFEYKYRNGQSKYLLRKVLERYLPKHLIERPKMGFGIPIFEWFKEDFMTLLDHYVSKEALQEHSLLNISFVENLIIRYKCGEPVNVNKLWLILVFQMWFQKWKR